MKRFTELVESGAPIECTIVTRHETPDGSMHTRERGVIGGSGPEMPDN